MFRINVTSTEVDTKSGIAKRTGNPYSIREQVAIVDLPNGERRRVRMGLENDEPPMAVGQYEPKPSAFYIGDFDSLAVSTKAKHWQLASKPTAPKVG